MSTPLQGLPPCSHRQRILRLRQAIERALLGLYERQEKRFERWQFPPPEQVLTQALTDDDASGQERQP